MGPMRPIRMSNPPGTACERWTRGHGCREDCVYLHGPTPFGPPGRSIGNALTEDLPYSPPIICLQNISQGSCKFGVHCLHVHPSVGKLSRGNSVALGRRGRAALTPSTITVAELAAFIDCSTNDARRLAVGSFECPQYTLNAQCAEGHLCRLQHLGGTSLGNWTAPGETATPPLICPDFEKNGDCPFAEGCFKCVAWARTSDAKPASRSAQLLAR